MMNRLCWVFVLICTKILWYYRYFIFVLWWSLWTWLISRIIKSHDLNEILKMDLAKANFWIMFTFTFNLFLNQLLVSYVTQFLLRRFLIIHSFFFLKKISMCINLTLYFLYSIFYSFFNLWCYHSSFFRCTSRLRISFVLLGWLFLKFIT